MELPLRPCDGGCLLTVRVTPNSSADKIEGLAEDDAGGVYLKVRVRAVPEKGAANKAVCRLIAKALGLPKSAVRVDSGDTARLKQILLPIPENEASSSLHSLLV